MKDFPYIKFEIGGHVAAAKIIGYIDMYRHLTGLTNDDVVGQFQYRINSYTVWFKDPARLTEFVLRCPSTSVYTYKVIDKWMKLPWT